MKRLLIAAAATAALAGTLSGCATPTPYQPAAPSGGYAYGYSELKLDNTHWRINFAGNSLTSRETVERYLLHRAAELTLAQGYEWFDTTDRRTDRKTRYYAEPDPFYGGGFGMTYGWGWRPSWRYYGRGHWARWDPWGGGPFWGSSVDIRQVTRYEAGAEIVMGRGAKPDRRVFDAREVLANLGPAVVRPAS